MSFLGAAPLRKVTLYQWDEPLTQVPADKYWTGTRDRDDGKKGRRIIIGEAYQHWPQPDRMILVCGHLCDFKRARGQQWYNRSKRCLFCALEGRA